MLAFDSRSHGHSGGEDCTYDFFEKQDLDHILDTAAAGPILLVGTSLGAAVALQHAADGPRVSAVIGAETFSDLRTVATELAPFFLTIGVIADAFGLAEGHGRFKVDDVSPVAADAKISVPVFLVHGEPDTDTPPDHSRRVFAALRGPKQLVIVPGAGHNGSFEVAVWDQLEGWIDDVLGPAASARPLRQNDVSRPGHVSDEQ